MQQRSTAVLLSSIALDPDGGTPLHRQLFLAIREAILSGRLSPNARLPATRVMAKDLSVSRNTVVAAFDQLMAEGYIEGRVGAGSFVSRTLPEELLHARREMEPAAVAPTGKRLSKRGEFLSGLDLGEGTEPKAFSPGVPELPLFPFDEWARLLGRRWRRPLEDYVVRGDPAGYRPLREAIASYLGAARAVNCDPDQIIIVSGSQQALDLSARVLIDPGDTVWVEEPGYPGIWGALLAAGARLVSVPVDEEGLDIERAEPRNPAARMVCVTPSHQYPLGVTMSLARRLKLLEWAKRHDAFILEDDYNSEYRYRGRPISALQGLDEEGRVIYVGTMSKVMFPGLRLGYMVVPPDLVEAFLRVRILVDSHPSSVALAALADFIGEGYLNAHVRRMRQLYAERQQILLDGATMRFGDFLDIGADDAGMHLVGYLDNDIDDVELSRRAQVVGVELPSLSSYYRGTARKRGFLFGYAGIAENEINSGLARLDRMFRES